MFAIREYDVRVWARFIILIVGFVQFRVSVVRVRGRCEAVGGDEIALLLGGSKSNDRTCEEKISEVCQACSSCNPC